MTNPGFESSGNWTEVRDAGFPGTSFSRCTQLEGCTPNNGNYTYVIGNLASGMLQSSGIAASPNKEYDLSAWVSGRLDDADCDGTGQVRVVYYNSSQVEISSKTIYTTTPSQISTTWQRLGKRILTPAGTATVRIQLRLKQVSGWLDFDDVSLQEVMTYNLYYDGENRMVKVTKGTTPIAAYSYDGDGLRVRQVLTATGATTTAFVKNYYEQSGTTITKYYYAGSQRVAVRTGTDVRYLFGDHLGSTSVSADVSGGSITRQLYKAWGETRYSSGLPTKYQYTGQYSNTSDFGLIFYNARWYDATHSQTWTVRAANVSTVAQVTKTCEITFNYELNDRLDLRPDWDSGMRTGLSGFGYNVITTIAGAGWHILLGAREMETHASWTTTVGNNKKR